MIESGRQAASHKLMLSILIISHTVIYDSTSCSPLITLSHPAVPDRDLVPISTYLPTYRIHWHFGLALCLALFFLFTRFRMRFMLLGHVVWPSTEPNFSQIAAGEGRTHIEARTSSCDQPKSTGLVMVYPFDDSDWVLYNRARINKIVCSVHQFYPKTIRLNLFIGDILFSFFLILNGDVSFITPLTGVPGAVFFIDEIVGFRKDGDEVGCQRDGELGYLGAEAARVALVGGVGGRVNFRGDSGSLDGEGSGLAFVGDSRMKEFCRDAFMTRTGRSDFFVGKCDLTASTVTLSFTRVTSVTSTSASASDSRPSSSSRADNDPLSTCLDEPSELETAEEAEGPKKAKSEESEKSCENPERDHSKGISWLDLKSKIRGYSRMKKASAVRTGFSGIDGQDSGAIRGADDNAGSMVERRHEHRDINDLDDELFIKSNGLGSGTVLSGVTVEAMSRECHSLRVMAAMVLRHEVNSRLWWYLSQTDAMGDQNTYRTVLETASASKKTRCSLFCSTEMDLVEVDNAGGLATDVDGLFINGERRRVNLGNLMRTSMAKDVETDASVGGEDRVLARDDSHGKRKKAAL
ncbi:hypothetical protein BDZ89DRAFT_1045197 [Hymenopellis radicata]|nr:hypothetical protein BDZ89DRAFT_1045197 [Hymenopellis radicata]